MFDIRNHGGVFSERNKSIDNELIYMSTHQSHFRIINSIAYFHGRYFISVNDATNGYIYIMKDGQILKEKKWNGIAYFHVDDKNDKLFYTRVSGNNFYFGQCDDNMNAIATELTLSLASGTPYRQDHIYFSDDGKSIFMPIPIVISNYYYFFVVRINVGSEEVLTQAYCTQSYNQAIGSAGFDSCVIDAFMNSDGNFQIMTATVPPAKFVINPTTGANISYFAYDKANLLMYNISNAYRYSLSNDKQSFIISTENANRVRLINANNSALITDMTYTASNIENFPEGYTLNGGNLIFSEPIGNYVYATLPLKSSISGNIIQCVLRIDRTTLIARFIRFSPTWSPIRAYAQASNLRNKVIIRDSQDFTHYATKLS